MSDYELTDIDSVGPSRADAIADSGFETVDGVASTSVDEFAEATDIAEGTTETIIASARALVEEVEDERSDVEEETEEVEGETVDSDAEETWFSFDPTESIGAGAVGTEEYPVDVQMDVNVLAHVIHVVLEEATKKHQSSNVQDRNTAYGVSRKLMALMADPDAVVDETISVNQKELSALYRAINQGSSDYASRSGIPKMWGTLESFKDVVNEQRKASME